MRTSWTPLENSVGDRLLEVLTDEWQGTTDLVLQAGVALNGTAAAALHQLVAAGWAEEGPWDPPHGMLHWRLRVASPGWFAVELGSKEDGNKWHDRRYM